MSASGRLVAALACLAAVATGGRGTEGAGVALNFQDVELAVLARFVSDVTGRNFILDERVRGTATIISPTRITPDEAYRVFQSVLAVKGFATVPSGTFVKIVPVRDARESALPDAPDGGDQLVTRILTLAYADPAGLGDVLTPLVSKDGILSVHADTGRLVLVDHAANAERIARLVEDLDRPDAGPTTELVPLRHATADALAGRLEAVLGSPDGEHVSLVPDPRANAILLVGKPAAVARARQAIHALDAAQPAGRHDLHVHHLRHASAADLVAVLAELLGLPPPPPAEPDAHGSSLARRAGLPGPSSAPPPEEPLRPVAAGSSPSPMLDGPVRLTADPATNALLVSAGPGDWETLLAVITDLDTPRRQVFVEAIILEATVEKTKALGIEVRGTVSSGDMLGLGQVNLGTLGTAAADPTSLPGLILAAASDRTVTLPGGEEVPAHSVLLTALQTDGDLNVLSAPNIVTTDNQEAEIVVGRNVPFIASRATDSSDLDNLFTTVERHDVGITLRMTPQIVADDFVRLTLFEEDSDIDEVATAILGDPAQLGPTTTIRSTSTVVSARDGQTIVIGGLLADTIRSTERSVPFLGRIPVLGNLFRRNTDMRVKTNLLVFLTPHVITSDADMARRAAARRAAFPHDTPHEPVLGGPSWRTPDPE
jgi:general secretion pathway protein D